MSEVETLPTETTDAQIDTAAVAGADAPDATTIEATPAETTEPAGGTGGAPSAPAALQPTAQPNRGANPGAVDITAEYDAIDALTAKYERGEITYEDHAKQVNAINRKITTATIAAVEPVKQTIQQTEYNRKYWSTWGKGTDVAQVEFAKTVNATKANELYKQAMSSVEANPRYANRPEMDTPSIVYAKWLELMEAESKKKPGAAVAAPVTGSTRLSGASATQVALTTGMTAREKLDAGVYDQELRTGKFG